MPSTELDSTADKALGVVAETIPQLFHDAALGMFGLMAEPSTIADGMPASVHIVTATAIDYEVLLVEFLNELLYLHEETGWFPIAIEVEEIYSNHASNEAEWRVYLTSMIVMADTMRKSGSSIKAATYHDLRFGELDDGGFTANLTFDV